MERRLLLLSSPQLGTVSLSVSRIDCLHPKSRGRSFTRMVELTRSTSLNSSFQNVGVQLCLMTRVMGQGCSHLEDLEITSLVVAVMVALSPEFSRIGVSDQ